LTKKYYLRTSIKINKEKADVGIHGSTNEYSILKLKRIPNRI
jgi:hypothetical protein